MMFILEMTKKKTKGIARGGGGGGVSNGTIKSTILSPVAELVLYPGSVFLAIHSS